MNSNPTLSELIESAIRTVSRIEVILDRAEERERKLDAMIEKFAAVFAEDDDADVRWAPAFELPEPAPAESIAASTPDIQVQALPTVTGEGPAVDLAIPRKNPSGPDRFAIAAAELDPEKRDLPMDPNWPPLPELPEGKTRWVNRGDFRGIDTAGAARRDGYIKYLNGRQWCGTSCFSGPFPHIEAIAEEPVAAPVSYSQQAVNDLRAELDIPVTPAPEPVAVTPEPAPATEPEPTTEDKPRLAPEVGNYYWTRNKLTARILQSNGSDAFKGELYGIEPDKWLPFFWHADGTPYGTGDRNFDLVEICPF